MSQFKIYPGSKAVPGLFQFLINNTPYHERYFELFAGRGGLFYNKKPASFNCLNDLSDACIAYHRKKAPAGTHITQQPAAAVIDIFNFSPLDFVYLDPPYPASARRSGAKYYEHEMLDETSHADLLQRILHLPCMVMISTRENALYSQVLSSWRKESFETGSFGGSVKEVIFMNYPTPTFLHQYDFLGNGNINRQAINRKRNAYQKKMAALDQHQRHALIIEMIKADAPAVKHFLSRSGS